jgi:hypothetical protein
MLENVNAIIRKYLQAEGLCALLQRREAEEVTNTRPLVATVRAENISIGCQGRQILFAFSALEGSKSF